MDGIKTIKMPKYYFASASRFEIEMILRLFQYIDFVIVV